ncbi:MAG: amidohydrolase [Myxococcota bacterium]|nr:amidohydrolase [Myxococcota bacterium]
MNALLLHPCIYLDAAGNRTDALLVRDGVVTATGDDARAQHDASREPVIEPPGACLFPALADAHIHLWGLGQRVGLIALQHTRTPAEILDVLAAHPRDASLSGWIEGHGWDQHRWPDDQNLTRAMLDEVCPDVPVCLYRVDHHAALVNSAALRAAGVDRSVQDPEGGRFGRTADGDLDGLLVDDAISKVTKHIPPEDEEELAQIYSERAMMLRSFGITCAHMAWTSVRGARMTRSLHERAELPIRTVCMVDCRDEELDELLDEGPWRDEQATLSIACIKFFADGAMGSRGALMETPYRDGSTGIAVTSARELSERIPDLMRRGWQVAAHAIGDLGGKNVLDAYELAGEVARRDTRPRLEHAQIVRAADFERYEELGVIASMQPIHFYSDGSWASRVIDDDQLSRLYCWRTLDERTVLAGGSDFPIDDPNPWHGIATFLTRTHAGDKQFHPEQAISLEAALAAYTTGAAFAAHWEDRLGKLEVGFQADVIALDRDPFTASAEQIWDMCVLHTFAGFDPSSWILSREQE